MRLSSIVPDRLSMSAKVYLFANILNGLGNGTVNVVLQLYLMSLGFDSVAIGSIVTMNFIGMMLFTIPSGVLADHYGKKKIVLLGFSLFSIIIVLILTARSLWMFRLAFFLLGINNATGVVWTPLYSSFFEKKDMDRAFGLLGFVSILSNAMGSLMGFIPPMLVHQYGYTFRCAYWLTLIIAVGFFVPSMPFYLLSFRGIVEPKREGGFRFTLRSKGVVAKFGLISLIGALGYGVFFSLFPYYLNKKFGIQSDALGILYFLSNFAQAGANILAPRISQRLGTLKAIVAALGLCAPFYLMIPLAPSFTWLSVAYILRLFSANISTPLTSSLFMRLLCDEEKATANSIRMMASQGGNVVAPMLGGRLMEQVSLDLPAYLGASLYVAYSLSFYLLLREEATISTSARETEMP